MRKMELLAPAGDFDKLKTAIDYGADAVYLAGQSYGLRTASKNFSDALIQEAVAYAHERGVKVYVTVNMLFHPGDFEGLGLYLKKLEAFGVDAIIVSDPGVMMTARDLTPGLDLHISTQTSTLNPYTVRFWAQNGAKRAVLARELSFAEIKSIYDDVGEDVELEVFVHGAMCISYSGRCLLSNYMTGRDSNAGDCAQSCRWTYSLVEEKRPGEYWPIEEDEKGTYIFNSKDLCLLKRLPELKSAGVTSLKIEGRVKSQYYVATVVRSYRLALDALERGSFTQDLADELIAEIRKVSHRPFTEGFAFDRPGASAQNYADTSYIRNYEFIGQVMAYDPETGLAEIEQRNRFATGETVELFGPAYEYHTFVVPEMTDAEGNKVTLCPHPQMRIWMPLDFEVRPGDMLRRRQTD